MSQPTPAPLSSESIETLFALAALAEMNFQHAGSGVMELSTALNTARDQPEQLSVLGLVYTLGDLLSRVEAARCTLLALQGEVGHALGVDLDRLESRPLQKAA